MMTATTLKALAVTTLATATALGGALAADASPSAGELGTTQETEHFSVPAPGGRSEGPVSTATVKVCAKQAPAGGTTRVSWDPWTLETADGAVHRAGEGAGATEASFPEGTPSTRPAAERERQLRLGECAEGTITFDNGGQMPTALVYRNGYGEHLTFRADS